MTKLVFDVNEFIRDTEIFTSSSKIVTTDVAILCKIKQICQVIDNELGKPKFIPAGQMNEDYILLKREIHELNNRLSLFEEKLDDLRRDHNNLNNGVYILMKHSGIIKEISNEKF